MGQLYNVKYRIRGMEEFFYDVVFGEDENDARSYFILTSQDCEVLRVAPTFQGFKWQAKSKKYIGRVDYYWARQRWEYAVFDKKNKTLVAEGSCPSEIDCIQEVITILNNGDFE